MPASDDDLDEVALNVLLAEGLDVPTAMEASRRDGDSGTAVLSSVGLVILVVVALLVIAILIL